LRRLRAGGAVPQKQRADAIRSISGRQGSALVQVG
jgi:hypothetical protein